MIVGGGNSGAQILAEVSKVAETFWVTQQPPSFLADDVDGRVLFLRATERLKAQQEGRSIEQPIGSLGDIVMIPSVKDARQRNVLHGLPPFDYLLNILQFGQMEVNRTLMPLFGVQVLRQQCRIYKV